MPEKKCLKNSHNVKNQRMQAYNNSYESKDEILQKRHEVFICQQNYTKPITTPMNQKVMFCKNYMKCSYSKRNMLIKLS